MKFQIQVRGSWGGVAGDWRPAIAAPDGDGAAASTFRSWDEAEEVLDRMQLAGLLPYGYLESSGAELRIIDLDERVPRGAATSGIAVASSGALAAGGPVTGGALEPDGSGQRAA
jgi:hypothetical protein